MDEGTCKYESADRETTRSVDPFYTLRLGKRQGQAATSGSSKLSIEAWYGGKGER